MNAPLIHCTNIYFQLSSTNSISFLATNDNLTFRRFSSLDLPGPDPHTPTMRANTTVNLAKTGREGDHYPGEQQQQTRRQIKRSQKKAQLGLLEEDINFSTAVWTTSNMNKLLGNNESANIEFQYLTPSTTSTTTATSPTNNSSADADGHTLRHLQRSQSQNNKNLMANNSTIKLVPDDEDDDKPSKQVGRGSSNLNNTDCSVGRKKGPSHRS